MPQHKSAEKRVRQIAKRRAQNRYHKVRVRTMIKTLEGTTDADAARPLLNETKAYLDRLVSKGIFHKNKVAHTKSQLDTYVDSLS